MANSNGTPCSSSEFDGHLSVSDGKSPKRRRSWRQEIFNRVVTPAKHLNTPSVPGNHTVVSLYHGIWDQGSATTLLAVKIVILQYDFTIW